MSYKAFISYSHAADGKLAPALQTALEQFAKPWHQMRAFRIFRDSTNLSVSPELWTEIETALRESEFLICMASPKAAKSEWVQKEQTFWREHKDVRKLLIVVTDGEIVWNKNTSDFDWERTTAIPETLRGAFRQEPLWLDFRATDAPSLSLNENRFLDAIATIAAPLHGRTKDEIFGEHIREHRKTMRIAYAAVAGLLVLFLSAVSFAWRAEEQRRATATQARVARERLAQVQFVLGQIPYGKSQTDDAILWWSKSLENSANSGWRKGMANHIGGIAAIQGQTFPHDSPVHAVGFSPDGRYLLVGSGQIFGEVGLWNLRTGMPVGERMKHFGGVACAVFSSDGKRIVTASNTTNKTQICSWNAITGVTMAKPIEFDVEVSTMAMSPDGRTLIIGSGGNRREARFCDAQTGEWIGSPLEHNGRVNCAAFSADGTRVVTGSDDKTARLWNVQSRAAIGMPMTHRGRVRAIAFCPTGSRIVTGGGAYRGELRLWDAWTGQSIGDPMEHERSVRALAVTPDGTRIITAHENQTVQLWDTQTGERHGDSIVHESGVNTVAVSPTGRLMAIGGEDNSVRLWSIPRGVPAQVSMAALGKVTLVAFSRDGTRLVSVDDREGVRFWDAHTVEPMGDPSMTSGTICNVRFCEDAKRLCSWSVTENSRRENEARMSLRYNDASEHVFERQEHFGDTSAVAMSLDGTKVIVGLKGGTARLHSFQGGKCLVVTTTSKGSVDAVAFDFAESRFATATNALVDRRDHSEVQVWSAETGEPIGKPLKLNSRINAVAFSHDSSYLATGSADKTARLWDSRTGLLICPPIAHEAEVLSVNFDAHGSCLVTGCANGDIRLWHVPPPAINDPIRLRVSVEVRTAKYIDESDQIQRLTGDEWLKRRKKLEILGGPCDAPTWEEYNEWKARHSSR